MGTRKESNHNVWKWVKLFVKRNSVQLAFVFVELIVLGFAIMVICSLPPY